MFLPPVLASTQVNAGINLTDGITFLSTFANTTTRSEAIVVGYNNGSSTGFTQSRILAIDNPNNNPSFLSGQNTIHSLYTDQTTNSKLLAATAKVTAGGITLYAAGTQGKVLLANYFPTAGPQGLNFPTNWIAYSINYPTNNPIPDVTDIAVDNNGLALAVLSDGNMLNNFNSSSPAYIQNTATQAKARTIFPGSTSNTYAFIGAENGNITMVNLPLTSNPTFILQATFNALPPLNGVAAKKR
ncbi:MAG: hypothetical protein IPJ60_01665 [Sphingobacteriaceae bacterium]|nr:hypothetical protein [Sphingobacteriaceae bacterium]